MRVSWQRGWRWFKIVLTPVILACVGWEFAHILWTDGLWRASLQLRPAWCVAAGLFYLLSLALLASFWYRILRQLGQQPTLAGVLRAYFVGQLSRYVPGKVVGLVVRAGLLSGPGGRKSTAALTIVYETLTTALTGTLLAAIALPLLGAEKGLERWLAIGVLVLVGITLLPPVFNRLGSKVATRFAEDNGVPPAPLMYITLLQGIVLTTGTWGLQGLSLWALLQGLLPQEQPWNWTLWLNYTSAIALATTLGFLVAIAPGGLGVREALLQQLLAIPLSSVVGASKAAGLAVLAVLLLRLVWIISELIAAGLLYWTPTPAANGSRED